MITESIEMIEKVIEATIETTTKCSLLKMKHNFFFAFGSRSLMHDTKVRTESRLSGPKLVKRSRERQETRTGSMTDSTLDWKERRKKRERLTTQDNLRHKQEREKKLERQILQNILALPVSTGDSYSGIGLFSCF